MFNMQLVWRFIIGGGVVTGVALLARVAGTGLAGRFMTVPALTALSLWFTYSDRGRETASAVAKAGLLGLLPVAAYLVCIAWAFQRMPRLQAYLLSLVVWVAGVVILQFITHGWMQLLTAMAAGSGLVNFIRVRCGWQVTRFVLAGLAAAGVVYAFGQGPYASAWYGMLVGSLLFIAFLIYRKQLERSALGLIWVAATFVSVLSFIVAAMLSTKGHGSPPTAALSIAAVVVMIMSQDREVCLRTADARSGVRFLE